MKIKPNQLKTTENDTLTPITKQPINISNSEVDDKHFFTDESGIEYITIKKSEYETIKAKYGIVKSTLESVLCFIVPQNLRDLVNKTMREIA
jgi:hypothetical protein